MKGGRTAIRMTVEPHTEICEAAGDAVVVAQRLGIAVRFEFNGIELCATFAGQFSTVKNIANEYMRLSGERATMQRHNAAMKYADDQYKRALRLVAGILAETMRTVTGSCDKSVEQIVQDALDESAEEVEQDE